MHINFEICKLFVFLKLQISSRWQKKSSTCKNMEGNIELAQLNQLTSRFKKYLKSIPI